MGKTRDLFKKIRDTKATFQATMGSIKDRNCIDRTEAEDRHGCLLSLCLFNLYAEYMQNARLAEAQARIKTARKNINNLRYADDTNHMAESEEDLKSLFMKVEKESEKVGFKLNIQQTKLMASGLITSWQKMKKQWK